MKSNYKQLGDYIRIIDERNRDLEITNLLGVSTVSYTHLFKESAEGSGGISGTHLELCGFSETRGCPTIGL